MGNAFVLGLEKMFNLFCDRMLNVYFIFVRLKNKFQLVLMRNEFSFYYVRCNLAHNDETLPLHEIHFSFLIRQANKGYSVSLISKVFEIEIMKP